MMKRLFWNMSSVLILAALVLVAHVVWFFDRRRKGDFVPASYAAGVRARS